MVQIFLLHNSSAYGLESPKFMKLPARKAGIKNYLLVARKCISNFYICRLHPQNDPMKKNRF